MNALVETSCPCGLGTSLATCCGRWTADRPAPTAGALMRSRYCAYVRDDTEVLLRTWHASTRPKPSELSGAGPEPGPGPKWLGLQVLREEASGPDSAIVEFVARYSVNGRARRLHETSRFRREGGTWYYVDGDIA